MEKYHFTLNGKARSCEYQKGWTLMRYLRDTELLTGTKCGCQTGDCGACMVLFNGRALTSCTIPMKKLEGANIVTIEGLASYESGEGELHPLQQAFIDCGAVQCGFCTPGMIIRGIALLQENPHPSKDEIKEAFKNNFCRCTGYVKIIKAVQKAAIDLQKKEQP